MSQSKLATFSIAAVDSLSGELVVASCSNYLALGPLVLHCAPPAGVLLSQSQAHPEAATAALQYLQQHPEDVDGSLAQYLANDAHREHRQVALLNAQGHSRVFSGQACVPVVEHYQAPGVVAIGNMLVAGTVAQMIQAFNRARQQPLVERCVAALQAGARHGGDKRGKLAAAVQAWRPQLPTYQQLNVRVDASATPLTELSRLVQLHRLYHPLTALTFIHPAQFSPDATTLLAQLPLPDSAAERQQWLQRHNLAHHLNPQDNTLSTALLAALPILTALWRT